MKKLSNSLLLAAAMSGLLLSGCGSSSDSEETKTASSAVDVTVERGKVYGAVVKDSSSPALIATQNGGSNAYRFTTAPTYPVIVTGGWIDVNDNGVMDSSDVNLDIEMKSYSNTVTPVSTYLASFDSDLREGELMKLRDAINNSIVLEADKVTTEDLLQLPSISKNKAAILANSMYLLFKTDNQVNAENAMSAYAEVEPLLNGAEYENFSVALETTIMNLIESRIQRVTPEQINGFFAEDAIATSVSPLQVGSYRHTYIYRGVSAAHIQKSMDIAGNESLTSRSEKYIVAQVPNGTNCASLGFTILSDTTELSDNSIITTYMDAVNGDKVCAINDYTNVSNSITGDHTMILVIEIRP